MLGCKFLFSCKLTRGQATSESKYYLAASAMKNPPAVQEMQDTWVQSLGWKDSLEEMTTYPSVLVWEKIPWTREPGRLESMGLQRVRHD